MRYRCPCRGAHLPACEDLAALLGETRRDAVREASPAEEMAAGDRAAGWGKP